MHKSVMRLLAFPLFIGAFYSCRSNKTEKPPDAATAAVMAAPDTAAGSVASAEEEDVQTDSSFKNFPLNFGDDGVRCPAAILATGQFHEEEVGAADVDRSRYGLFQTCERWLLTVDPNEISL